MLFNYAHFIFEEKCTGTKHMYNFKAPFDSYQASVFFLDFFLDLNKKSLPLPEIELGIPRTLAQQVNN